MRRVGTCLALSALAFTAGGCALALHNHECAADGEHHEHQDCVEHFVLLVGCGAQPEAPVTTPAFNPTPHVLPLLSAQCYLENFPTDSITPRGPPPSALARA